MNIHFIKIIIKRNIQSQSDSEKFYFFLKSNYTSIQCQSRPKDRIIVLYMLANSLEAHSKNSVFIIVPLFHRNIKLCFKMPN